MNPRILLDDKPADGGDTKTVNLDPTDTGFIPGDDSTFKLAEGIDKQAVDYNEFDSIAKSTDPNRKKDEPKKVEPKEGEADKVDSKAVEVEEVKGDEDKQPAAAVEDKPEPEIHTDDTKVETDEQKYGKAASELFPKMAKEGREFLKARLDDIKELKTKLSVAEEKANKPIEGMPASYLDHPQAYQLDPKYNQATTNIQNLNSEVMFWRQQLRLIRNGDKWQLPQLIDGKVQYKELDASADADEYVSDMISQGRQMIKGNQDTIQGLQDNFKTNYEKQQKDMQDLAAYYFPEYVGDKGKDNSYIKVMDDLIKSKGHEKNVLAPFVKYLYALAMEQVGYIKANQEKWNGKTKPVLQPSSADINNAGGTKKPSVDQEPFDEAKFKKEMGV